MRDSKHLEISTRTAPPCEGNATPMLETVNRSSTKAVR